MFEELLAPELRRVHGALESAEAASRGKPATLVETAAALLDAAEEPLRLLGFFLSGTHPERAELGDATARLALGCQVRYARATDDWTRSTALLERAAACAVSKEARAELAGELEKVRQIAAAEPLRAVFRGIIAEGGKAKAKLRRVRALALPALAAIEARDGGRSRSAAACADELASSLRELALAAFNEEKDLETARAATALAIERVRGSELR